MEPQSDAVTQPYKDKRAGLMGCGVVLVLVGSFFALAILVVTVCTSASAAQRPGMEPTRVQYLYGGLLAVLLVTLGFGSMLARRWARTLILIMSWYWLIFGIVVTILCVWLTARSGTNGQSLDLSNVPLGNKVIGGTFLAILYLLIPGMLVLFYRNPHVKATCDTIDCRPRWTDKCPLPVLAIAVLNVGCSILWVIDFPQNFVLLAGPWMIKGWSGAAANSVMAAIMLVTGFGMYRLRRWAWWSTLIFTLVFGVFRCWGNYTHNQIEIYQAMGCSKEKIAVVEKSGEAKENVGAVPCALLTTAIVAYLFVIRRYFFVSEEKTNEHTD